MSTLHAHKHVRRAPVSSDCSRSPSRATNR